jgi:hypothetical protein
MHGAADHRCCAGAHRALVVSQQQHRDITGSNGVDYEYEIDSATVNRDLKLVTHCRWDAHRGWTGGGKWRTSYLTDKEFAAFLEIDEKTLRRLKDPEQRRTVSVITRRRIAERLGRPPHTVVELLWTPSPTYLAEVDALLDNGDTELVAGDPETGRPCGQRLRLSELDGEA